MKKVLIAMLFLMIITLVGCGNVTTSTLKTTKGNITTSDNITTNIVTTTSRQTTNVVTTTETVTTKEATTVAPTTTRNEYTFPDFYVNTDYGRIINSKETYIHCLVSVDNSLYNITDVDAGIRGRGNSTWAWDKKPYRVKFDSKVNLFNNGKAKSWTLIANHCDLSLSRNYLAFSISRNTDDIEFTSSAVFVNLYLNNEYRGVYLVCDQMQTGKTRVNVNEELNGNPAETGYLIEMDVADRVTWEGGEEGKDFFTLGSDTSKAYVLKTPDTDDENYSVDYLNYIKDYMMQVYTTLTSSANNTNYDSLVNLMDLDTFVTDL